jgi:YegS/Rv2252/BmrU family lipid kinase
VIFNPAAARGRARRRLRKLQQFFAGRAVFEASKAPGHAEELAHAAARAGLATVVAAGGDGTVHEVANGVLRAGSEQAAFGVIPLGSGNDYADSLGLPAEVPLLCRRLLAGDIRRVDVGLVRDERGRQRYFVNSLGLGLSGAVAYEARKIRGLRGLALYGLAALRAIWRHFHSPQTALRIDGRIEEIPTLYLAIALGRREGGGFIIAPEARLDDGLFDYLHAGRLSRLQALSYLPRLALGWLPDHDSIIRRGQCRSIAVQSATPLLVHLDGELFARPEDGTRSIEVQLLPKALPVRGCL